MLTIKELPEALKKIERGKLNPEQKAFIEMADETMQAMLDAQETENGEAEEEGREPEDFTVHFADETLLKEAQKILDAQSKKEEGKGKTTGKSGNTGGGGKTTKKDGKAKFNAGDAVVITEAERAKASKVDTKTKLLIATVRHDDDGTFSYKLQKPNGKGLFAPIVKESQIATAPADAKEPAESGSGAKSESGRKTKTKTGSGAKSGGSSKSKTPASKPKKDPRVGVTMHRSHTADIMIINRVKAMLDKSVEYTRLRNVYAASQKAFLERDSNDPMPYDGLLIDIDAMIGKMLEGKKPGDKITVEFPSAKAKKIKAVASENEVYAIVRILKSYLTSFAGKYPTKDAVERMRKRIRNAVKSEKIREGDPFFKAALKIRDVFNQWQPAQKIPIVNISGKGGLQGLFGFSGTQAKLQGLRGMINYVNPLEDGPSDDTPVVITHNEVDLQAPEAGGNKRVHFPWGEFDYSATMDIDISPEHDAFTVYLQINESENQDVESVAIYSDEHDPEDLEAGPAGSTAQLEKVIDAHSNMIASMPEDVAEVILQELRASIEEAAFAIENANTFSGLDGKKK